MISTSVIHINTALLPVYFGGAGIILHSTGRIKKKIILKDISYRLFMLTSLVTVLTCAFGGASIKAVERVTGVDPFIVKIHAWTATLVLLFTLALAFYSWKAIRAKGEVNKIDKILFMISIFYLIFFISTTLIAFKIR